ENPDIWITIREGMRKDQIAKLLEDEFKKEPDAVFQATKFLALTEDPTYIATLGLTIEGLSNLEGFLFPDKYLLPKQSTEDYVIKTLVNTFILKTGGVYTYEDIIIASMVEREGMTDQDRPMIADIIKRRLKEGWLLQIDATLLYYYKDWRRELSKADIDLDQPYNTYTRPGLPPTPIANPGLSAINATKNPKANQYYFYIHSKDGTPYYATTYQEHLLNIANYLR
ncbi:MAG TPA: endolytic transglycosylase MltG, partial [Candidatus Dojkabacteria bacterium]|nr:endolytic transglycosylase MltG [Candidatus Dojkabacteria bacterium]